MSSICTAFPRCCSQTVSNQVQLHHLQRPCGIYIQCWGERENVFSQQSEEYNYWSLREFQELFLQSEQCSTPRDAGVRFSLSLTAALSECRLTHLRLGFGLKFPAVVKVVYRCSVFCPHRCWRESGCHPSQPNFYIPAFLEHAWGFAIQNEAELAQPMHYILLIRQTLNPWCPCLKVCHHRQLHSQAWLVKDQLGFKGRTFPFLREYSDQRGNILAVGSMKKRLKAYLLTGMQRKWPSGSSKESN